MLDEITKVKAQCGRLGERLKKARATERETASDVRIVKQDVREDQRWEEETAHRRQRLLDQNRKETSEYSSAEDAHRRATAEVEITKKSLERFESDHEKAAAKIASLEANFASKKAHLRGLASRREIYQTDVKLDQILSVLKLGCLLLVQFILHKFFDGLAIEFNTFIREIVALRGVRIRTKSTETIQFVGNRRNPKMMTRLEEACRRLNAMGHEQEGRVIRFEVVWPKQGRHAT